MSLAAERRTSAAIYFDLIDVEKTVFLRVNGEPNDLKRALRAACSHRRSIVLVHPNEYFCNFMHQIGKSALDSVTQYEGKEPWRYEKEGYFWNYRIDLLSHRQIPYIHYHSRGKDETHCPLYQFLGTEFKRQYERTPARRANPGGRPKEKWLKDALFRKIDMSPKKRAWYEKIYAARQRKLAAARKEAAIVRQIEERIPLGIKHIVPKKPADARRIIHVDFSDVPYLDLRAMSRRDIEELDPGYEDELNRLYGRGV